METITLLVGLGGIGCSIVDQTYKVMPEEAKSSIGAVGIDTCMDDLQKLTSIKKVWIGFDKPLNELFLLYPEYSKWFPLDRYIMNRGLVEVPGQIRSIGRLALAIAAREPRNALQPLEQEIDRILCRNKRMDSVVNVFITGSITGGTGSGIFLQVPFYIRNYIEKKKPGTRVFIQGMFLSADIIASIMPSLNLRTVVMSNAYASLKELNAFYLAQNMPQEDNPISLEFYDPEWYNTAFSGTTEKPTVHREYVPYDSFCLTEGTYDGRNVSMVSLERIKRQLSRILDVILLTPMNRAVAGMNYGMKRYSAAGLMVLRYPYEQMLKYVSLRYYRKLLSDEGWLFLDEECRQEMKYWMDNRRSDPSINVPEMSELYRRIFEKEVLNGEEAHLASMLGEAFIVNKEGAIPAVCRATGFLQTIDDEIDKLISEDPMIKEAAHACAPVFDKSRNFDDARAEVQNMTEALRSFYICMKNRVEWNCYMVSNMVFPLSYDSMMMYRHSSLSVYHFLGHTHPVAARYLCCVMIRELEERVKKLSETAVQDEDLSNFYKMDFDSHMDGIQDADQALENAENAGFLFRLMKGNNILRSVKVEFMHAAAKQVELIESYGKDQIRIATYHSLLRRFKQLAQHYETFFETIASCSKMIDERIALLEGMYAINPDEERIIYGSADAFRKTFEDFCSSTQIELPEAVKAEVFTRLFRQACTSLEFDADQMASETRRKMQVQFQEELDKLVDTKILKTIERSVAEKDRHLIDISIKEAAEREMVLSGMSPFDRNLNERRISYERFQIERAMAEAAPMLETRGGESIYENVILALHPDSAELNAGVPDVFATADSLVPEANEAMDFMKPFIFIEPAISRHEMICLRTKHGFTVENLVKYGPESEFAGQYKSLIAQLDQARDDFAKGKYRTVITPHLARNWHDERIIPAFS